MEPPPRASTSLFQVYLRLKPPAKGLDQVNGFSQAQGVSERYLTVEQSRTDTDDKIPTHITITPPLESRRRAVEKFAFTRVFQEASEQLEIFKGSGIIPLIEGVLGADGKLGRDGLLATLGVTGSGKSHTILGSRSQRGMTQMSLDVLFKSLGSQALHPSTSFMFSSLSASDPSEAQIMPANTFLDSIFGEVQSERGQSRAATPMTEVSTLPSTPRRRMPPRPSALPQYPGVEDIKVGIDTSAEYAVLVSMYEVYNDRIFDLLTSPTPNLATASRTGRHKDPRTRRPLLFKSTEQSPDRKVVAGLRKIICGTLDEALLVLETGLMERRIAGTGSNSASSRSHGFFCVEVKKRNQSMPNLWWGSTMTIVDLAGSERARNAKTAGATLAEAGKINESLMYLGQCLQMQSDSHEGHKSALVPFRQCKLTELLFSNSFPSISSSTNHHSSIHRNPQKAIMIVTADPLGDFNATSQILRYSALAREVTVPRIVSVTSTILSGASYKGTLSSGSTTSSVPAEELEVAAQEIVRLGEEVDVLQFRLLEEERRRREAEMAWRVAEERCSTVEQETREECWADLEKKMEEERSRWKTVWGEEVDRKDDLVDKKLEILTRSIQIYEDPQPTGTERIVELEDENDALRHKLVLLERELQGRSPTKSKKALSPVFNLHSEDTDVENMKSDFSDMMVHQINEPSQGSKTPGKKIRKLTTRKWDLGPEELSP